MNSTNKSFCFVAAFLAAISIAASSAGAWEGEGPLIIDHTCTDLSKIPSEWIDSAKTTMRFHYAHTSHGNQIPAGLNILKEGAPQLAYAIEDNTLPTATDALCLFNGQIVGIYITPHHFWVNQAAMDETRATLTANPSINISMFVWCREMDLYQDEWIYESVSAYLDSIPVLEAEFPDVTFIYGTGNAQATGAVGYNRWYNNERIRAFCIENDKVLYDFADLDAWWYDPAAEAWDHATYEYDGNIIPVEHPHFSGGQAGHTTFESCEQKARAIWWLATRLSGWDGTSSATEETTLGGLKKLFQDR